MIVQTKSFRRTISATSSAAMASIEQACTDVENEVNTFLATLNPLLVLDVQTFVSSVGENAIMVHVHSWVTYKQ